MSYLLVFIGGGIGAALRHAVNRAALAMLGPAFPWGTLLVNVTGSLLMGVFAGLFLVRGGGSQELRLFVTTGILGGFTTFSAFSLDAAVLWQRGDHAALTLYVTGSVVASVGALFLGMSAARTFIS
ncbi:MAG TPA: fluoride efflux transporter CrcB [Allosphingosinicella sp.]|nr:fluoride efflux transporter CrcB [Allosphingosinicella sp.]